MKRRVIGRSMHTVVDFQLLDRAGEILSMRLRCTETVKASEPRLTPPPLKEPFALSIGYFRISR